ncbi:hypothetical protein V1515DRAFT_366879 [Lipomyces mesembrius]
MFLRHYEQVTGDQSVQCYHTSQIYWFNRGLRDEIQTLMIGRKVPNAIEEYVQKVIRVDNAWRAHRESRRNPSPPQRVTSSSSHDSVNASVQRRGPQPYLHPGEPMQLDATRVGHHISQEDKNRRRKLESLFDCGYGEATQNNEPHPGAPNRN